MKRISVATFAVLFFFSLLDLSVCQTDAQRAACVVVQRLQGGFAVGAGSGCVMEHNGKRYVITCAHVVREHLGAGQLSAVPGEALQIRSTAGVFNSKEVSVNIDDDVAILSADELPAEIQPLKLAEKSPAPGDPLQLLTRGGMTPARSVCHIKEGPVAPNANGSTNVVCCVVQHGDSGAVFINSAGEIVSLQSAGGHPAYFDPDGTRRYWPAYGPGLSPILDALESAS